MDGHDHLRDLVAAYVLGAVTPAEAALVEEHLAACPACRDFERQVREVEARLPALAGELPPPPHLKARLMAIVTVEAPTSAPNPPPPARPLPPAPPVRARAERLRPLLAAAALLAVALAAVGLWRLAARDTATHTVEYALRGTAAQPSITGVLRYAAAGHRLALDLRGLKPLAAGRVYELWLIRGNFSTVTGIQVFRPDDAGHGHLSVTGPLVPDFDLAGLTVERGLSTTPHPPIVAQGKIRG